MSAKQFKIVGAAVAFFLALALFLYAIESRRHATFTPLPRDAEYWTRKTDSPEISTQCVGLQKLGELRTNDGLPAVIRKVKDDQVAVRLAAVRALRTYRSAPTVDPLISALADSELQVRITAAIALGETGDPKALEPLRRILVPKAGGYYVARAVAKLRTDKAEDVLIDALSSSDPNIRLGAVEGLAECGTQKAVAALQQVLYGPLAGLDLEILNTLLYENEAPRAGVIADPCKRAIETIKQRLTTSKGGRDESAKSG